MGLTGNSLGYTVKLFHYSKCMAPWMFHWLFSVCVCFFAIDLEVYLKHFCTTETLPMLCLVITDWQSYSVAWTEFCLNPVPFLYHTCHLIVLFFRQISLINSGFFFSKISIALLPIMKIKLMQPCIWKHTFETSMGGFWTLRDRNYFPVTGSGKQRFPFHCSIYTTL